MSNRHDVEWATRIPYGPLTEADLYHLALSFNDSSQVAAQEVARARGVEPGDAMATSLRLVSVGRSVLSL